ncbi:class I SAM-dependent methyltransferase [Bacillus taeanensis]|uniref:class I SAM-dependent methyltransferase n=1 Tax=Bacillus taeanensis TaxID=273032 RepID=UPI000DE92D57|nr:class I SAM-dependent methyltransferase [Bacillus taeanensis]
MKNQVIKAYNKLAHDYEHNVDHYSPYNTDYERPAMMCSLPKSVEDLNILDAGCAAGWYTETFLLQGANVTSIDISPEMVAATKRRVGNKAKVMCLDLSNDLPFQDQVYDIVVSSLVLHYIEDWTKVFKEFSRILKPNGIFLFSIHHPFMDVSMSPSKNYFSREIIKDKWKRGDERVDVWFYRRPLHEIINVTSHYFVISRLIEPLPTEAFKGKKPESYEKLMKNPNFLIIKAKKSNTTAKYSVNGMIN